jgi:hypothetical protein
VTFTYTATIFEILQLNRVANNASDVQTKGEAVRSQPWLLSAPLPAPLPTDLLPALHTTVATGTWETLIHIYHTNDVT